MKNPSNQILLACMVISLVTISCQFLLPVDNDRSTSVPETESGKETSKPFLEGIADLFGQTGEQVNIGGVAPRGFSLIGQLGGSTQAVFVEDDLAFLGQGPRVVALDISHPDAPKWLGESEVLPGLVTGLEVIDRYAYAVTLYGGLTVLDISNPAEIKKAGYVEPKMAGCEGILIEDNTAYMACNSAGLFIADIRDPRLPKTLFESTAPGGADFSLALIDNRIYIVNTSLNELEVFNVENPRKPEKAGALTFSALPSGEQGMGSIATVRSCGKYLCLAAGQDGLVILDISRGNQPSMIGHLDTQSASGLVVEGNTVYLADDMDGVHIIDITDPANPAQIGQLPTAVGGWELTVKEHGERGLYLQDGRLWVTDPAYGLTIVDTADPAQPRLTGGYMTPLPDVLSDIRLDGKTAYITGRYSGFRTVDISNPKQPAELFYDDERKNLNLQTPSGLQVRDGFAYIADMNYPFHIYDVSDPAKPEERGAVFDEKASDGAFDLVLNGSLAYLSGWGGPDAFYPGKGIWVVDIAHPNAPEAVNFIDTANERWILALAKNHLYALDGSMDMDYGGQKEPIALRVFDLADPQKPAEVQTIPLAEAQNLSPMDMTTDGSRLYIHVLPSSVLIYDLAEPVNPKRIAADAIPGGMPDIYKDGKYLYLGGSAVYDISKPDKPGFAGLLGNLQTWDLAVDKDLVYVVTTYQGMYIFRFDAKK
jgi:hypothetical protein